MTSFPNPATQFKPGQSGNPGGMSRETRAKIDAARDKAADVYLQLVTALSVKLTDSQAEEALEAIRGDNLKLLKDVMDRSIGSPKQQIDNTSSDGSMSPSRVSDEVLEVLKRKHAPRSA